MSSPDYDSVVQHARVSKRLKDDSNGSGSMHKKSRKQREYKTYNYDPLPRNRGTIRILELFSSEKSDAGVLCGLITPKESERDQYPYEALSWCWGVDRKTDYIRIQRNRKTYDKFVSPNLVAALKALRHPDRSRYLWVDMVCIDQENLDEKNHQVEMMDIIYGNAERVCIWLGEANESSRMALRFIKNEVSHLQSFDTLCDSHDASKKWVALLDLMQRPWFSRRWVVQELALARKPLIYCGDDKISWKKFAIAVELFVEVETATHRLSEVMKKDRQYQYIPSYFEFVSALGASLLVDATERLFRDHQEDRTIESVMDQVAFQAGSESDTSPEASDSEDSDSSTSMNIGFARTIPKTRIQPLLSLEYLVSSLTIFETTVPHDTIYALLAIAKDTTPRAVAPGSVSSSRGAQEGLEIYTQRKSYNVDYNLPYVDVCKGFIKFAIERSLEGDRSRALDVICRPWAIEERKLRTIREDKKQKKEKQERDAKREKDRQMRRASRHGEQQSTPVSASTVFANSNPTEPSSNGSADETAELEDMPLPSWVPQLSGAPYAMAQRPGVAGPKMSRINADPLVGLPSMTQRNYSAAETKGVDMKTLRFRKRPTLHHYSMYARGFKLDRIDAIEQVARNGQIPMEWAELGGWERANGHPPEAFWRTLVANRGTEGKNPPVFYSRACEESFKKGGLESGAMDTTALIEYERNSVVAQFCRRVQAVTWNRALARTSSGRLALVGKDVEKNDRVCILYGCSVPVVLRESKKKDNDVFAEEIEHELRDIKNTVVQSFRRYMSRKRRHEVRKDLEMATICRRWLKGKHSMYTVQLMPDNHTKEAVRQELLRVYSSTIKDFKAWLCEDRHEQWARETRRSEEATKPEKAKPAPMDFNELLPKQARFSEDTLGPRKRRKSRSSVSMRAPSPAMSSVSGTAHGPSKDLPAVQKKKKAAIDWWAFECALVVGRRWLRLHREWKAERRAFALESTEEEWAEQKRGEYSAFLARRQQEDESSQATLSVRPDVASLSDTESQPGISVTNANGQHESLENVTEAATVAQQSIPTASDNTTRWPKQPTSTKTNIPIRPSWAVKTNRDVLSEEERADYDRKIRKNLREKLGDEGYYSYKLLGDCYIHGFMDGEAMLYQNEGDEMVIPSMVFEIR